MKKNYLVGFLALMIILVFTTGCDFFGAGGSSDGTNPTTLSSNADLSALTVSDGTLSPGFTAGTTAYTLSVVNSVTSVTVTGTKADTNASVNGPVTLSGLVVGASQTATITVTAEDGTTKDYTVIVTRAQTLSTNANLSALTVSNGTLSPVFAAGTTAYAVSVANSVTSVTVTGTKADTNASVNGPVILSSLVADTPQTATITVTAEDGTTTKDYQITVTSYGPFALADTGPAGGYIVYINPNAGADGWTYLEAAPANLTGDGQVTQWMSNPSNTLIGTSTSIGSGLSNSLAMQAAVAGTAGITPAVYCLDYTLNGFSDWFLPSKDEFLEVYNVLRPMVPQAISFTFYNTSSENDATSAIQINADNGTITTNQKSTDNYFNRPVRRF